ncbi:hypothetical protein ABTN28_18965, partial [Acinetobacter baumannii]
VILLEAFGLNSLPFEPLPAASTGHFGGAVKKAPALISVRCSGDPRRERRKSYRPVRNAVSAPLATRQPRVKRNV